uniref:Uncharacterized protein n=1 Tax=viral metagenome TaxID=1070528 RepID=A0A6M3KTP2_9ZZZZ
MLKKFLLSLFVLLVLLVPSWAGAAGTVTQTWEAIGTDVVVLTFSWTADSGVSGVTGAVSGVTTARDVDGYVILAVTNPGSTAPTDNYDIVLHDSDGVDVMGGQLANRDTANGEHTVPKIGSVYGARWVAGVLGFHLSGNSTASATGTLKVFLLRR